MTGPGLSYDQAPPLGLPLRFFLVAPLFLALAGSFAFFSGGSLYASRWNPATLAVTHLLTLGFLGLAMVGALLQMMPVVLGTRLPAVRPVAWAGLIGIGFGTLTLATGLVSGEAAFLIAAAALLAAGLLPFLVAMLLGVARSNAVSVVAWPMRQAWLGLLAVLVLGIWLVFALTGHVAMPDVVMLTDSHMIWGLGGWVLILVTGVAYQVVPMLQLTPAYPAPATRWLTWFMLLGLAGYTTSRFVPGVDPGLADVSLWFSAGSALAFALLTLWLQKRRRRKLGDATLSFWRFGMACLAGVAIALPFAQDEKMQIMLAALFLLGFAASVVCGMLYKIVPFLAWFHLQAQRPGQAMTIPNMKQFVSEKMAVRHLHLHVTGTVLVLAAPWLPGFVSQAGALAWMASSGLLWLNLLRARRLFLASGGIL